MADEESNSQNMSLSNSNTLSNDSYSGGNYQGTTMTVPERIVLDGSFERNENNHNDLARDLQGNGVDFETYMGGMATPPRTLTVDDTTFAEKTAVKNNEETYVKNRMFPDSQLPSENNDKYFQLQTEIVRLNNRVSWLEKKIETTQSTGYWKTTLVCLLTVVNPLIIHWLFSKRRF